MLNQKRRKRASLRAVGEGLAAELRAVVRKSERDGIDPTAQIAEYVRGLGQRHPEWQSALDKARNRRVGQWRSGNRLQ